jgi:hypothetical protein
MQTNYSLLALMLRPVVPVPQIALLDADVAVSFWRNVIIQIWRRNAIEPKTRAMRAAGKKFLASTSGDVGIVVVVEETCPIPDNDARQNTLGFLNDMQGRSRGIVLVFEGEGFRAAASRAVMVGLMMASRFPMPYKIVSKAVDVAPFLGAELGAAAPPAGHLLDAIEWTRAQLSRGGAVSGDPTSAGSSSSGAVKAR